METLSIIALFVGVTLTTFLVVVGFADLTSPAVGVIVH